jgi:hypothetical protein
VEEVDRAPKPVTIVNNNEQARPGGWVTRIPRGGRRLAAYLDKGLGASILRAGLSLLLLFILSRIAIRILSRNRPIKQNHPKVEIDNQTDK